MVAILNLMELVGALAAVITIFAFFPQTYQVVKTRQTRDISLLTYSTLIITSTLWTIYGIWLKDVAIYITNMVICLCCMVIVTIKLKER